jgi:hypothetical protein
MLDLDEAGHIRCGDGAAATTRRMWWAATVAIL